MGSCGFARLKVARCVWSELVSLGLYSSRLGKPLRLSPALYSRLQTQMTTLFYLLLAVALLSCAIEPCAASESCATTAYGTTSASSLLSLEGTWSVELPLLGNACLQTFGSENPHPQDTVTFVKAASGFTARSTYGNVAALGGCSCQTIAFGNSDRGSPLPLDSRPELAVTYDIPTVYDGALVGTVEYCVACNLRAQNTPTNLYCSMFTVGGANMGKYCEDLPINRGARYDPRQVGIKSTSYTYSNGVGTCCMTYQHASVLVSSAKNASELVLLTIQDEAHLTTGCGKLTVLHRNT